MSGQGQAGGGPGGWAARRFWTRAEAAADGGGGWQVLLDGRVLRTPGKQPLRLPTAPLAEAIAAEWQAQGDLIRPEAMPLTRAANSAIERVAPQRTEVAMMLAAHAGTDLLCYRATHPRDLAEAQARDWQPLLDWAAARYGARLAVTAGIMPLPQDAGALAALAGAVAGFGPVGLTALHDLVTLPGSLVLGLAVAEGRLTASDAHRLARLDEDHQAALWGRDAEAEAAAEARLAAMRAAETLWTLLAPARGQGLVP